MNQCDHIELATDDPDKAVAFYSSLFGWKITATPSPSGGPYHMFRNANGGGGIGGKMNGQQPTAWMPFITVKSVRASMEHAKSLGATPIPGFEYMPIGDMGAIGGFFDPTGAALGLWESNAPPPAPKKVAAPKKAAPKKAAPKAAPKRAAKKAAPKKAAKKKKR